MIFTDEKKIGCLQEDIVKKLSRVCQVFHAFNKIIENNDLKKNENVENVLKLSNEHLETFVKIDDVFIFSLTDNK